MRPASKLLFTASFEMGTSSPSVPLEVNVIIKSSNFNTAHDQSVNAGVSSSTNSTGQIAIGASATATSSMGVAIGFQANAGHASIALGRSATTTAANQLVVGSQNLEVQDIYFGAGVTNSTASVFPATINATGGQGLNRAGSALILAGGKGTGNADGGEIIFKTAPASGSSSSTANALTEAMRISSAGLVGIGTASPGQKLHISSDWTARLRADTYSSGSQYDSSGIHLMRARGTQASPTYSLNNDRMGFFVTSPYNPAASSYAEMSVYASEHRSAANMGMFLRFETVPNGTTIGQVRRQSLKTATSAQERQHQRKSCRLLV